MYGVYYTNHGCKSDEEFHTVADAISYGKSKGFEFSVTDANNATLAWWTTFGGTHYSPAYKPE